MAKYIHYDYNQTSMVVINYQDQIQPGTFEHAVHYLVDNNIDLTCFDETFSNDDNGRPAYDPAILLKIILFAYSKGITSSRQIEWCCKTNVIFKALSCDSVPHYTTIAGFVSGYPESVESVFEQVLLICHEYGLLGNELFAIDGCKLPSDAAKTWSGTHQELQDKRLKLQRIIRHHMDKHQKLDATDKGESLQKQRAEQSKSIETLKKASKKIEKFLAEHEPRMGKGKRKTEVKSNITDNDSAKMTTSKGTIQGYNGVATVDKKHQIVVDAEAFGSGVEQHTLKPVLERIKKRFNKLGIGTRKDKDIFDGDANSGIIITADTGFADEANMKYLHTEAINGYIPDNQFRSRDPKFTEQKKKYPRASRATGKYKATIPASEFDFDPTSNTCHCPAGKKLHLCGIRKDTQGRDKAHFIGRLKQCRGCKLIHRCMKNPKAVNRNNGIGRQVIFAVSKDKKPNYTDWMKRRVDSEKGKQIYSHRMSVVEPVFGNICSNKGLKRFSLRSKIKVNAQWKLFCLIQNIEKIANYGKIPA